MTWTQQLDPAALIGEGEDWPLNVSSAKLEASRIVKTSKGILFGFTVLNTNAASRFIQVFDASSLPADGAVPDLVISVAASSSTGVNWIPGRTFHTGCFLCNSTTAATKTLGSADSFFDVQYL